MGNCHSSGAQLLALVECGQTSAAKEMLEQHPVAACYSTYVDRTSPLLVAAGRGHYRMVQAIVEAAVVAHGPARAKHRCINHTNHKGHSALMLACMNGHAQCVESLVCNGASPLALDNSRHNTALHWAASACRSECVQRLLGSSATFQMQSGEVVRIADIPCFDEDNTTLVKFVDRHNGWGLTALQIAVFKGSTSTVRALLRNSASVATPSVAPSMGTCSVSQPVGSTALHMAAAVSDISMVWLLLEAQAGSSQAVPDVRRAVNSSGQRPVDVARAANSSLLLQLLDPNQPLAAAVAAAASAARRSGLVVYPGLSVPASAAGAAADGVWGSGLSSGGGLGLDGAVPVYVQLRQGTYRGSSSRRGGGGSGRTDQPPHLVLGQMLQRLRLVLTLEAVDLQSKLEVASAAAAAAAAISGSSSSCRDGMTTVRQMKEKSRLRQQQQGQQQQQQRDQGWEDQQQQQRQHVTLPDAAAASLDVDVELGSCSGNDDEEDTIPAATDIAPVPAPRHCATGSYMSSVASSDQLVSSSDDDASVTYDAPAGDVTVTSTAAAAHSRRQPLQLREQQLRRQAMQRLQQQHAQQRLAAAEVAALQARLKTVQGVLSNIGQMLAKLPASARSPLAGSSSSSNLRAVSPAAAAAAVAAAPAGAAAASTVHGSGRSGRRHRRSSAGGSSSGSSGARALGWSFLNRVTGGTVGSSSSSAVLPQAGGSSSNAGAATAAAVERAAAPAVAADDAAAEQVLAAFVTPGMLNSLAAVTKLLVNSSALSGKQQQQQQDLAVNRLGSVVWPAGLSNNTAAATAAATAERGGVGAPNAAAVSGGLTALQGCEASGAAAAAAAADADARWAEQEHALLLMRSILQTISSALQASQQAVSAAASRAALRQRQQEQLAALLSSERVLSGTGVAARRVALGSSHHEQGPRPVFASSSSSSHRRSSRDRDLLTTLSSTGISSSSSSSRRDMLGSATGNGSSSSTRADVGSSTSWLAHSGHQGLGLHQHQHLQHGSAGLLGEVTAAGSSRDAAAASSSAAAVGLLGGSRGSSSRALRRQQQQQERHERQERHHRGRSGRRPRGVLVPLPDPILHGSPVHPLSITSHAAAAAATGDPRRRSSSSSSSRRHRGHRHHRHRHLEHPSVVTLTPEAAASLTQQLDAHSNAAAARRQQQQQQEMPQRCAWQQQQQHIERLQQTLAPRVQEPNGSSTAAAAAGFGGVGGFTAVQSTSGMDASLQDREQQQQQHAAGRGGSSSARGSSAASQDSGGGYASDAASSSSSSGSSSSSSDADAAADAVASPTEDFHSAEDDVDEVRAGTPEVQGQAAAVHGEIQSAGSDSSSEPDAAAGRRSAAAACSDCSSLDGTTCAICMDGKAALSVSSCSHSLCVQCAFKLCCKARGIPLCPFCRQPIGGFAAAADAAGA